MKATTVRDIPLGTLFVLGHNYVQLPNADIFLRVEGMREFPESVAAIMKAPWDVQRSTLGTGAPLSSVSLGMDALELTNEEALPHIDNDVTEVLRKGNFLKA